jgi:putative ABC transport system permease protein
MPEWKEEVRHAIADLNLALGREEAIADELAEHLAERYDELVARGMRDEEARGIVLRELNEDRLRGELRSMFKEGQAAIAPGSEGAGSVWSGIGNDIRLAARQLRLNPGFAAVALLSLALGVGANAAIFALIDAVVLRTLPVPDPQQLAEVRLIHGGRIGSTVARQKEFSFAIWEQVRQQQQGFSNLAAWSTEGFNLGHGGEARYADGMWVSGSFFGALELRPALGRLISPGDDVKGCGLQGAVISYGFWHREFGGRAGVIGSKISLDRNVFPIIGVTPATFTGLEVGRKFDVALPLCSEAAMHSDGSWTSDKTTWWLAAIGRLKPGWSFERASSQLDAAAPGIFRATLPPNYDSVARRDYLRFGLQVQPAATGDSPLRKEFEQPLYLLLAISGLVLLIACANIANLMLARAGARQREMALRIALGATRARIVRQLLAESLLIAAVGAAAGAALAWLLSRGLIVAIATTSNQVYLSLAPDWRMLAFTAAIALLTCVVFGVAPALQAASARPGAVMQGSGRAVTEGRQRFLVRRGFVVAQLALSLVLVVAAFLFVRSFRNLVHLNAGFQQQNVLVAGFGSSSLNLPISRRSEFKRELLDQVRALPGVIAAADTSIVPLSGDGWNEFLDIPQKGLQRQLVNFSQVSSDYFRALEVPVFAGRDFDENDGLNAPSVAIVNRAFAREFFGDANAVGETFHQRHDSGKPDTIYRIVGIVGDTRYRELREEPGPIVYVAESQDATPDPGSLMLIRSSTDMSALIASVKGLAAKNSPEIVLSFSVLRNSIRAGLGRERLMAALSGFYGGLAALLAMIGIYGIMSYSVARRKVEIGIRMALGATRRRILSMILREAFALLGIGLAVGAVLVVASGRAVQSMLFGLRPGDPLTLAIATAAMALVALIASLIPARRAAALEPMQILREE